MSITNTLNSVQNSLSSLTSSLSNVVNSATSAANTDFSALLSQATATTATATTATALTAPNPAAGKADFVSGQIGVNLKGGVPAEFVYFDAQGNTLRKSTFTAESLLKNSEQFGINLTDTLGLKQQLESAHIGYKPYELYPGTGSDHGINFDDLLAGGLGAAYDWRRDDNVQIKDQMLVGTAAQGQASRLLDEAQALSDRLGLVKNSQVTTERGIDPNRLTSLLDGAGQTVSHVVYTGGTASWYSSAQAAQQAQASIGGTTLDLTDVAVPNVYLEQAAAEASPANAGGVSPATPATPATPASPPVATESNPVSNDSSSAASVASQASPTTPASAVTALQEQINQLTSGISSGTNTPMSSFMNSYNQLQALMAKMTDLQKTLAAA